MDFSSLIEMRISKQGTNFSKLPSVIGYCSYEFANGSFCCQFLKNVGQYLSKGANRTVCIFCGQSTPKFLVGMPILTDDCNFV